KSWGRFLAMTPARILVGLGIALMALATAAQGALGSSPPLRFASAPARVVQGGHVDVTVAVRPASAHCALAVRYANGAHQAGVGGRDVRQGVNLQDRSGSEDALDVNVLVNFVMENSKLSGSASTPVTVIPAGGTYALGGNLSYDGIAPVSRLEVVVTVAKRQP